MKKKIKIRHTGHIRVGPSLSHVRVVSDTPFSPSLASVFHKGMGSKKLDVFVAREKKKPLLKGRISKRMVYAQIESHRPTFQLQKLLASVYALFSPGNHPIHSAMVYPPNAKGVILIAGTTKTWKSTLVSRLCSISDPNTGKITKPAKKPWDYLADDVVIYNSEKNKAHLVGSKRTRCINFPEKKLVIEAGKVKRRGYSVSKIILLDNTMKGGDFDRILVPMHLPKEVVGHPDVASQVYEKVKERGPPIVKGAQVYKVGTKGDLNRTLDSIRQIARMV